MTFDLDDSVPFGTNGPSFAIYDAISNVQIDFSSGSDLTLAAGDVVTSTGGGTNHAWDASGDIFSGGSGTIPDLEMADFDGNFARGVCSQIHFVLFDNTGSMYAQSPPELFAADLSDSNSNFVEIVWDVQGDTTFGIASMFGTVNSITVPEPGLGLGLAAGLVLGGFGARSRRAKG